MIFANDQTDLTPHRSLTDTLAFLVFGEAHLPALRSRTGMPPAFL